MEWDTSSVHSTSCIQQLASTTFHDDYLNSLSVVAGSGSDLNEFCNGQK